MLELASHLRELDSEIAPVGLRERSFPADAITDDFDLSEALVRPESIAAAFRLLTRTELAVLRLLQEAPRTEHELRERLGDDAYTAADVCVQRFLAFCDGTNYRACVEVSAELDHAGVATLDELLTPELPAAVATHSVDTALIDRRAAERAARTCSAIAELLVALSVEPARQLAKGGIALPDVKRISTAARIELADVESLMHIAALSGLVLCQQQEWLPAVEASSWLDADMAERWAALAAAVWSAQATELRAAGQRCVTEAPRETPGTTRLAEILVWEFPALPDPTGTVTAFTRDASLVGIVVGGEFTAVGRAILARANQESTVELMRTFLPSVVHQVYVQPDASVVVPGPATPQLDRMLRRFADVEHADLASTFRITPASLNRALATGLNVPEIRTFLTEISLSGIPQPVEFMLADAELHFGEVRVREFDRPPVATAIRTLEPALLDVLLVDQSLAALGCVRVGDELHSRVSATHALVVLDAAKYPAVLENEHGDIVPMRPNVARARDTASAIDPIQAMWARVRAARDDSSDESAWLRRQVQAAVKARTPLMVEVRLPDGGVAEYPLEPIGLAGNRLRARDRRSEIERTLPLSSISRVRPLDSATN